MRYYRTPLYLAIVFTLCAGLNSPAIAQDATRFDINRFVVSGATLLTDAELNALVAPFSGTGRDYGDIQRAIEIIEHAYRKRGYAAVQVYAPEQELTGGQVQLTITETVTGKIIIDGKSVYFDEANLRASLPALKEGTTVNAHDLSAQIAMNNENPAKQIEVILGMGKAPDTIDARVKLTEENPLRYTFTADNTGSDESGRHRIGAAIQHANLWNRDHVSTLAFQTSPDKPDRVEIYSLSYRLPIYAWAGAIDFIAAKSTVDSGTTPTTAGDLSFAGSGRIYSLRYTHALPREGDTSQKIVVGWDVNETDNSCAVGAFGAAGCGSANVDVTLRPISLTYSRLMLEPGSATDFNLTVSGNVRGGKNGSHDDFQASRPSPDGGKGARADYGLIRGSFTHMRVFPGDWQARLALSGQWTDQALLGQEQFGMAGSNAVRGFLEREVARDIGTIGSIEGYTPDFAQAVGLPGNLRSLLFIDAATGHNELLDGEIQGKNSLSSWGWGLRYALDKTFSGKLDVAQIMEPNGEQKSGRWRGHFSLVLSF